MKITLSKKQWEFIGKKTGWMKIADSENIDNEFKTKHPVMHALLSRLPGYKSALDIVDNIKNKNVSKENAGIDEGVMEQAKQIIESKENVSWNATSNKNIIKESFDLDARVIAAIILIILGFFVGKMMMQDTQNTTKLTQQTYEQQMESIRK